ncbi:WD40 repeat-like protein [Aulographum hederae CBS 113979]|uniref:WD40 repeat-like protein n=1 Tax=Aulographum hederae CBS 113979 TaxID=1176131 RepID=A0A6G1GTQ7_9PEZI|nr:WD40 repeat-like protein [Aulographum hederae CBS 113979]
MTPTGANPNSQQNLNQIVLEYLSKKGYSRTEAMLRRESQNHDADGRPVVKRAEDAGGDKFNRAMALFENFLEDVLDIYKPELQTLIWPVFVNAFLSLVEENYFKSAEEFLNRYGARFEQEHPDDMRQMKLIRHPEHIEGTAVGRRFRSKDNKYRVNITSMAYAVLIQFLEQAEEQGGSVILTLMSRFFNVQTVDRAQNGDDRSLSAMLAGKIGDGLPAQDEGIPGHPAGAAEPSGTLAQLRLGQLPMDPDAVGDIREDLRELDTRNPPEPGQQSLVDTFEQRIKTEPGEDNLRATDIVPLPPPLARDIAMEVQKVKENRDRFKMDGTTGGTGPGVSVVMHTFHNTHDSITCIDFSGDYMLVAAGMEESYIRVWALDGQPLPDITEYPPGKQPTKPSSSRRLIGHSGPVYNVSFSPSTPKPRDDSPSTSPRYLLSCSLDGTIRLWSLDVWQCLTAYKGHVQPVWDVQWGPYGHYFVSSSRDKTARLWSTDQVSALRIFAGHDDDVDHAIFHPNNAYVFTASADKTVRMWSVASGRPVRMFTGHRAGITGISCSPDGRRLASADDAGFIIIWDLVSGLRVKALRGHGKGGIWSLDWNAESNTLVSGGADGTVRVWDCAKRAEATEEVRGITVNGKVVGEGGVGIKIDGGAGGGVVAAGEKSKGRKGGKKEAVVSGDQISAFPTKKSPVYKVAFTRMNLVMAGGAYLPG